VFLSRGLASLTIQRRSRQDVTRRRVRLYTIYARHQGDGFTTKSICYSRGTHRLIYKVRAVSIKQAYFLAGHGQLALDNVNEGVCEIQQGGRYLYCAPTRHLNPTF
jgi:hypothetical protein